MRKLIILSATLAAIAAGAAATTPADARGLKFRLGSAGAAASTPKYIYVPRAYGSQNRNGQQASAPRNEAENADRAEAAAMRARAALEAEQAKAAATAVVTPAAHRLSARERQLPNGVICVAGC